MMTLRGHAEFIELVGKRGGPSGWWLVAVVLTGAVVELVSHVIR